jgi:hypothetical protein
VTTVLVQTFPVGGNVHTQSERISRSGGLVWMFVIVMMLMTEIGVPVAGTSSA